jgi:hypothetical protein
MPQILVCEHCKKPFELRHLKRTQKYCSAKCLSLACNITKICLNCGKEFTRPQSQNGPYCSKKCFYEHRKTMMPCAYCGKLFQCAPSQQAKGSKYCSWECRTKGIEYPKGENHYSWQGKRRDAICEICQTPFVSILHPETRWSRFCSQKCKGKAQSLLIEGKNNGRWTGGKSHEPYPIEFNNRLKSQIRERDNYQCQLCGILELNLNRKLDNHHIDYNKDNLSPDNLISLCRPCNSKVNHNREHWTVYFRSKMLID